MKLAQEEILSRVKRAEARVMDHFEVNQNAIRDPSRNRRSSRLRFAVWYLLYVQYKVPYTRIAEIYGKDHTTILNGVKMASELGLTKIIPTRMIHLKAGDKLGDNLWIGVDKQAVLERSRKSCAHLSPSNPHFVHNPLNESRARNIGKIHLSTYPQT